jgi:hypothetical protein
MKPTIVQVFQVCTLAGVSRKCDTCGAACTIVHVLNDSAEYLRRSSVRCKTCTIEYLEGNLDYLAKKETNAK